MFAGNTYVKLNYPGNEDFLETKTRIRFTSMVHIDKSEKAIQFYNSIGYHLTKMKKDKLYYKNDLIALLTEATKNKQGFFQSIVCYCEATSFLSAIKNDKNTITINF